MGMTITEKILAAHSNRESVRPGENVWCDVDVLMSNDVRSVSDRTPRCGTPRRSS